MGLCAVCVNVCLCLVVQGAYTCIRALEHHAHFWLPALMRAGGHHRIVWAAAVSLRQICRAQSTLAGTGWQALHVVCRIYTEKHICTHTHEHMSTGNEMRCAAACGVRATATLGGRVGANVNDDNDRDAGRLSVRIEGYRTHRTEHCVRGQRTVFLAVCRYVGLMRFVRRSISCLKTEEGGRAKDGMPKCGRNCELRLAFNYSYLDGENCYQSVRVSLPLRHLQE